MKKSSLILGTLMGLVISVTTVSAAMATKPFTDVPTDHWAYQAVEAGRLTGLWEGYADGTFGRDKSITRAEVAVAMYRNNQMMMDKMSVMQKAMDDKLAAMEKRVAEMENSTVSTAQGKEWDIIKEHVTSTYPISENYFDEHFKFVSSKPNVVINGYYDDVKEEWKPLLSDVTMVDYTFLLDDAEGNQQNFTDHTNIYLYKDKVLEDADMPENLSEKEKGKFKIYTYQESQPTRELKILLTKDEAIDIAKSTPECVDENFFNIAEAEKNITLIYGGDEIFWFWYGYGSYCDINAETDEVEIYQESVVE